MDIEQRDDPQQDVGNIWDYVGILLLGAMVAGFVVAVLTR